MDLLRVLRISWTHVTLVYSDSWSGSHTRVYTLKSPTDINKNMYSLDNIFLDLKSHIYRCARRVK